MTGWDDESGSAVLREDAARLGLSVDEYARRHDIDPASMFYGRVRKAREGKRLAHLAPLNEAAAGWRPPAPVRLRGDEDKPKRAARMTLPLAWRIVNRVRACGGVPGWARATGVPARDAQRRYATARALVLADAAASMSASGLATVMDLFPPAKPGRPAKRDTKAVSRWGQVAPQPATSPPPLAMASDGASEDLLPAEPRAPSRRAAGSRHRGARPPLSCCRGSNHAATPTPGRHARTPQGGRGDE